MTRDAKFEAALEQACAAITRDRLTDAEAWRRFLDAAADWEAANPGGIVVGTASYESFGRPDRGQGGEWRTTTVTTHGCVPEARKPK